ncbi:hypothetical protein AAZX31_17G020400 [Glycine max]|uniref:At4g15545-like C-terminal domain-containing protein n=2 Tax=Glycine subgen. Soja TaxID=1462606 RepID=I1MRC2_SOYBN|nr:uncharacterized protein At4g15545 [Glycine soja]XP_040867209.1 uncharacterized protein At4g15545 [Glycine max]XP_040867211.1 uncharacterized protein At4g15545 [Glycine max]KAG4929285.1 hypothetical protein JHK86_046246 [Glycine max]KAG4932023.1 hypothetical protein JHK87_046025 [Glycine soja]KAG4942143.1 hypothetical protein JHK85_046789 [Glycine max]KAG5096492.1 hypothetical protein JHK82_046346 [Glycine max]KAG5101286.1 hypothetical protein JHK84_046255 [Glycine max]|eukprot:XP_014625415.1 uncharacterized protein At4g15545 [Glycine max]
MAAESGGTPTNFDLPEEVVQVLPSDPFQQLDVARKITSIALSTRVNTLESELSSLRAQIADKDNLIADLQSQLDSLDASLSQIADKLLQTEQDKESLLQENASLSNTVKKLNRDVSKLEVFRKTLMQSLQEEDDNSGAAPDIVAKIQSQASLTSTSQIGDNDVSLPPSVSSSTGNSFAKDHESDAIRPRVSQNLLLASQGSTPRITPPGSPPSLSASVSPTRTSKPVSPQRHSISFATTRGMYDDRSSMFSSMSLTHGSISSSDAGTGSQTGRTRVDGKEFFRQVRNRLSYEQFGAFLANVKELNSHKQTKEETLRKADEIFGPENKDLYTIFEGLINRNLH